ncbi:MAG: hypothetical protein GF315_08510 [candidate division Zixibacteria bacterium]|nr:hypothetical protein [candidate division Zixibacteria bacterium]
MGISEQVDYPVLLPFSQWKRPYILFLLFIIVNLFVFTQLREGSLLCQLIGCDKPPELIVALGIILYFVSALVILDELLSRRDIYCCSKCGYRNVTVIEKCPRCKQPFDLDIAIAKLTKDLKSRDLKTCWGATRSIAAIGPRAIQAVPVLLDNLSPTYDRVTRSESAYALTAITGRDFELDFDAWRKWWNDEGEAMYRAQTSS